MNPGEELNNHAEKSLSDIIYLGHFGTSEEWIRKEI